MNKNLTKGLVASLLAGISIISASSAMAATNATSSFQVTATVSPSCVVTATNVAFGAVTPASGTGTAQATGTISATCTKTTSYTISLDKGTGTSTTERTMTGGTSGNTDKLAYGLFTDAGHTTNFGNVVGQQVGKVGTGSADVTTVYGQLATNQFITPDTYSDTINVSVTY